MRTMEGAAYEPDGEPRIVRVFNAHERAAMAAGVFDATEHPVPRSREVIEHQERMQRGIGAKALRLPKSSYVARGRG